MELLSDQVQVIELTQGQFALIDKGEVNKILQNNWHAYRQENAKTFYAKAHLFKGGEDKTIHMHRIIMDCPAGMVVDHINGNGLDNRKCNLRICSPFENMGNKRPQKNKSSQYKGVTRWEYRYKNKVEDRWIARIQNNNRQRSLGYFRTEVEAALAYDKAAKSTFGPYARLNFPHLDHTIFSSHVD